MVDKELLIENITTNWEKVICQISQFWQKFTVEHMELITDYDSLENHLKSVYKYTDNEIETELLLFMEKIGLLPIEIYLEQLKKALYQSTYAASIKMSQALERSVDRFKKSSGELQERLVRYVKENPLKAVGLSMLCGVISQKIVKKL